jgi:hypothetical protein
MADSGSRFSISLHVTRFAAGAIGQMLQVGVLSAVKR